MLIATKSHVNEVSRDKCFTKMEKEQTTKIVKLLYDCVGS